MRISDWSSDVCSSDLASVTWNYTTFLNIAFLALSAVLVARFLRTGGPQMLRMMNAPAAGHPDAHAHDADHADQASGPALRSEERRVGKECVRACRSRWSR